MKAAIYARFSSELQHEASIEDQVRGCRKLAEDRGWHVVGVYADRGISGASPLRSDFQRLLADANNSQFEIIVAEGLDRLSRDQATTASMFQQLAFRGVMIFTRAEGQVTELHVGLKGTMNALFLKDLAIKTHRGLEGRVRKGKSAGGRAYGYRVVHRSDTDGSVARGDLEVIDDEARVVRRIYRDFIAGLSPRAIARLLNAESIPGPRGRAWRDTTIRGHATRETGILRNRLYIGRLVWNKQTYLRNPDTGKRVARVRNQAERIEIDVSHLRIVDDELWKAVQARLEAIRASPGSIRQRGIKFWLHRRPKHLLTGLVHCGECNGLMAAVGKDYLACTAARSGAGCANRASIRRGHIEEAVLEGLKTRLMAPELVEEFIRGFHEELNRKRAEDDSRRALDEQELGRATKKLRGLYDAIADGLRSPGLQQELLALEQRQAELTRLIATKAPSAPRFHPRLADIYRERVANLHRALSEPEARAEAAEILRGLIEHITVRRHADGHVAVLSGDIVKLLALPGTQVPTSFESSVKVVAGARFDRELTCSC